MTREEAMGNIYLDLMCASGKLATLTDDDFEEVNILKRKIKALDMAHNALKKALQERPKGRWIDTYYENSTGNIYNCSNCEVLHNPNKKDVELNRVKEKPKFCPNCGADMRESEQE